MAQLIAEPLSSDSRHGSAILVHHYFGVVDFFAIFDHDGGVVVEALSDQPHCQGVLQAGALLQFSSLVLEPDLDLGLVQVEISGQ